MKTVLRVSFELLFQWSLQGISTARDKLGWGRGILLCIENSKGRLDSWLVSCWQAPDWMFVSLKDLYVTTPLSPKVMMVLWRGGGLWEMIWSLECSPHAWYSCLYKETPVELFHSFHHVRTQWGDIRQILSLPAPWSWTCQLLELWQSCCLYAA